jgi:hypothetical protein
LILLGFQLDSTRGQRAILLMERGLRGSGPERETQVKIQTANDFSGEFR